MKPLYDMFEIPHGKHPNWKEIDNRFTYEEDIRIHLYEALDCIPSSNISEEERECWEQIISSFDNLAKFYKKKNYNVYVH